MGDFLIVLSYILTIPYLNNRKIERQTRRTRRSKMIEVKKKKEQKREKQKHLHINLCSCFTSSCFSPSMYRANHQILICAIYCVFLTSPKI